MPVQSKIHNQMDDFHLITVLGMGSFGKVFLARSHTSCQIMALKVVRKPTCPSAQERLKNEIHILKIVKSPFICQMNNCFETAQKLYFALEFYSGGDLLSLLFRHGKLREKNARFYLAEIALGLEHLHGQNVLYRDLKPENILLDSHGHVKLSDFGLSLFGFTKECRTQGVSGTSEYMAPEILRDEPYGHQIDLWSFGIVALVMLTAEPVFTGETDLVVRYNVRNKKPKIPENLTSGCKQMIGGLLNKNPGNRWTMENMKSCAFFKDVCWEKVLAKGYIPPFKPNVKGDEDTKNFENHGFTVFDTPCKQGEEFEPYIIYEEDFVANVSNKPIAVIAEHSEAQTKERKPQSFTNPIDKVEQLESTLMENKTKTNIGEKLENEERKEPEVLHAKRQSAKPQADKKKAACRRLNPVN